LLRPLALGVCAVALAAGLAQGAAGQADPKPPTVSTCPDPFVIRVENTSGVTIGEYRTSEPKLRERFSAGPKYWWDCVYTNPASGAEAFLVKFDIVPPVPGQIPSGNCSGTRGSVPGLVNSRTRYLTVSGGNRVALHEAQDGNEAILDLALRRAEEQKVGLPCAGAAPSAPATTTKTVATPKPGASATVSVPVEERSTQATATISAAKIEDFAIGFLDRPRRLEKLRRIEARLEVNCGLAFMISGDWFPTKDDFKKEVSASTKLACLKLLDEVRKRIESLQPKGMRLPAGAMRKCQVVSFRLLSERRSGRTTVRVVAKSASPVVAATCKAVSSSLVLTLRRKGAVTLRQALGKSLTLTLARSRKAEAAPGSKLKITFAQR
jgi:hypothetical protein